MTAILFLLGPVDEQEFEYPEPLPPSIAFPYLPKYPKIAVDLRGEDRVVIEQVRYTRIGDTANYVCTNPPRGIDL